MPTASHSETALFLDRCGQTPRSPFLLRGVDRCYVGREHRGGVDPPAQAGNPGASQREADSSSVARGSFTVGPAYAVDPIVAGKYSAIAMTVRHRPTDHVVAKAGLGFVSAGERQYDKEGNGETGEGAHSIYSGTKNSSAASLPVARTLIIG